MEEKIERKVDFYCLLYEKIQRRLSSLNIGDVKEVALKIFEQVIKETEKERTSQKSKKENKIDKEKKLATKKQREALHKFGLKKIPKDLTKKEASEILDKLISYSKEDDREAISRLVQELNMRWSMSR
ncbi:MAG: hypothetical protein DRO65_00265 [Candidatus Altiarchaeales archaeon]|nr:MAG: hypothetical protein DRO65_00265 [Candidatus Altiarchaeales archaeon]